MESAFLKHPIYEVSEVELKISVMITKKSEKSDLENKKSIFFEIGMVLALAIALVAFEWSTPESPSKPLVSDWGDVIEEMLVDITLPEVEQKIKPPPPLPIIKIVDDDIKIPEPDFNFNVDIDINHSVFIPDTDDDPPVVDSLPLIIAEIMPVYREGGLINFRNHMQQIVHYPEKAIGLDLEGTVYVQFIVDYRGNVKNIDIIRGIDPLLDNEVIAAIQQSEKWKPGRQNGRAVNVAMSMPIKFELR